MIIIGMHRSGTSMTARLLERLGLFLGEDFELGNHCESYFFEQRNELILKACNGGWDNPAAVVELLRHAPTRTALVQLIRDDLSSPQVMMFLGLRRYLRYRSPLNLNFPWGWKDPRNTILLPLWLDLFPKAKVIHMVRNGVDVAASLSTREEKRLRNYPQEPARGGLPFKLFLRLRRIADRLDPLSCYHRHLVHRSLALDYGFDLWKYHLDRAAEWLAPLPQEQVLHVRYEDLLTNPAGQLRRLQSFCCLPDRAGLAAELVAGIRAGRAYAFRDRPELLEFYNRVKDDPLMQHNGYDAIELS